MERHGAAIFEVAVSAEAEVLVVAVRGTVDEEGTDALARTLDAAALAEARSLVVDVRHARLASAGAERLLALAAARFAARGATFSVRLPVAAAA